ncbi:MAG: tetratricopeptide repeat protein [Planctomycetota bacterium]
MKVVLIMWCVWLSLLMPVLGQSGTPGGNEGEGGAKGRLGSERAENKAASARVAFSEAGRSALTSAKEAANRSRGVRGPERAKILELAAAAYDKVVVDFRGEAPVAAAAAFAAADLWRQQGSLALAEKDYLLAAAADAGRYAQRGLLGAADMQRRQKRIDEAVATYAKAAAVDQGSARAQEARLWQARLLQSAERLDEAIAAFQSALESAEGGSQTIDAANYLASAWIHKGDLDAAGRAIEHAEQFVSELGEEDPIVVERLRKALESMSARKALQRARDKQNEAGKDAAALEVGRRHTGYELAPGGCQRTPMP